MAFINKKLQKKKIKKKKNMSPLEREMLKQERIQTKKEKERSKRLKARNKIKKRNSALNKIKSIFNFIGIRKIRPSMRKNLWLIILTCVLIISSVVMFTPPDQKINQGLDIQGGLSVVMQARSNSGEDISAEDMEASRAIIENRVNALGAAETSVQIQGNNQILVQIPGMTDSQTALNTIGKTGKLEFARLDSFTDEDTKSKIENNNSVTNTTVQDDFGTQFSTGKKNYTSVREETYTPLITGSNITNVNIGRQQGQTDYSVNVKLDDAGTKAFADATKELAPSKGKITIILDNEVQSAPSVQSEITGGEVSITGGYTQETAKEMQAVLQSGSLPVSFTFEQSQVVGPTLGQGALVAGVIVAGVGLLLVMAFLLFFYHGLGFLTAAAMGVFAIFYLGILATLSSMGMFSLSLSGLAGVVLTLGMAADSSVLVLERFKEEIRMGRSIKAASKSGVKHAIWTSIDADLVTLVSALCLFFLAAASVKGFGLTLAIGTCCDIVMMLIFKAPLIRLLAPKVMKKHPGFWGLTECNNVAELALDNSTDPEISPRYKYAGKKIKGRFIKKDINFLGVRRVFLTISAALVIACFVLVGIRGLNFSIEFVGGTSIQFHGTGDISTEQVRKEFDKIGVSDAVIQTTVTDGKSGFLVKTTTTDSGESTVNANAVAEALDLSSSNFEVTTIGPDWGDSVVRASLIAFLVSILLIIIYIAIRFEYKMGICAIIALLHDLIIVVGVYALFGKELSPNTIAALLTILGYSLYDTVVVFHRINDNMQQEGVKHTFMTMANHSINQVFIRSMNTTLTSLIPVLAMLFFGSETLKDFAFAMTIGLIFGAYSSVSIASPIFAIWKSKEPRYFKLISKYGEEVELMEFDHAGKPTLNLETKRLFSKEELDKQMKIIDVDVQNNAKKSLQNVYSNAKSSKNKGPGSKIQYKKTKKAKQKAKKK